MKESYRPQHEMQEDAEPSLPTDPTEAAAWLKDVWQGNGGWKGQHPLRLKVKEPGDYQALSEDEKKEFDALGSQFTWLAELHRSEMGWSQSYARSNHGEVIGFRFGYDRPENPEDNVPQAYVYRPFDKKKPQVYISNRQDGWHEQTLSDVANEYAKIIEE